MPGIKELKTRIKSIGSTRKITRAMQMVSAAKMRKAQTAALNSRTYSDLAWELISSLAPAIARSGSDEAILNSDRFAPLAMTELLGSFPKATKTGIIIISTNKGLVGSFNTNLIGKLRELESQNSSPQSVGRVAEGRERFAGEGIRAEPIAELIVMGRKAKDYAVRFNKHLLADFLKSDNWSPIQSIYPLAKTVSDLYQTGEYKEIVIIYSHFVSTLVQKATVKRLLPFATDVIASSDSDEATSLKEKIAASRPKSGRATTWSAGYLFEPSAELVLNHLIPRIIESQIYQAVLESDASEHSARMVMMKNATEAAGDLIADYTLTYNQLRQNKITTELAEITAGRIALE